MTHHQRTNPTIAHRSAGPSSARAFTLVEVISCVAILATVAAVSAQLIVSATTTFSEIAIRAELHARLSGAMERIVRELSYVQIDPAAAPVGADIGTYTATAMTWNTELSNPGAITSAGSVRSLTSGYVDTTAGVSQTLLPNATLTLEYFDQNNAVVTGTTNGTSIRRVQITLAATESGVTESIRTKVFLRSTMTGSGVP